MWQSAGDNLMENSAKPTTHKLAAQASSLSAATSALNTPHFIESPRPLVPPSGEDAVPNDNRFIPTTQPSADMKVDNRMNDKSLELDRKIAALSHSIHVKMNAVKKQRKVVQKLANQYLTAKDEVNSHTEHLVMDVRNAALEFL